SIVVRHAAPLTTPRGTAPAGSRSLVVGGSAIMGAAIKVQTQARRLAAHMLEAACEDVVFTDGHYQVKGVPDKALTLDAIAARAYGEGLPDGIESGREGAELVPRRRSSIPSAPTSRWGRSIARADGCRYATSCRSTTAGCACARPWWPAAGQGRRPR